VIAIANRLYSNTECIGALEEHCQNRADLAAKRPLRERGQNAY